MSKPLVDVDNDMLAFAQRRLGTTTKRDTINRALAIAAAISADDRARLAVAAGERRSVPGFRRTGRTRAIRTVTYLADTSAVWRVLRKQLGSP